MMLDNLSFSRFKAHFRVLEPVRLPFFTGSALRGALGHALRRVRYGSAVSCPGCSIRSECRYGSLYAYLFESPCDHPMIKPFHEGLSSRMRRETYPQPFVLDPPAGGDYSPGDLLTVPFTLVGKAIACFPFMACALSILGAGGLGRGRGRLGLEGIVNGFPPRDGDEVLLYEPESGQIVSPGEVVDFDFVKEWVAESFPPASSIREARIRFITPFRYKYEGKLGRPLTFEILMRNLLRRFTLLSVHSPLSLAIDYNHLLSLAASVSTRSSALEWYRWERYSARQEDWMSLDGYVGEIVFSGEMGPFLPYLLMGELSNVGKDGSFGLGKYELSIEAEQA